MRRQVTVTVADTHAGTLDAVAEQLRAAGLEVAQVLGALGVITGSAEEERIAALAAVRGVAAVQQQTSFQLPPPDADVQ